MKTHLQLLTLLVLAALACNLSVSITPDNPALPATPSLTPPLQPTTTPEIFIPLTRAAPGATQPTNTVEAPASAGTTATYAPLTVTLPQEVATGASGIDLPRFDSQDAAFWEKTPGHLQVSLNDYYVLQGKTNQPVIYVYPAQAYAEMVPAAFESLRRVDNLIASSVSPTADQLPGVPFFNAQQVFAANIQLISFQNGSGVRYLTEYAQYPASANNHDLVYAFQGVTRDGAYYIVAIFPVSHPVLAETSDPGAPLPNGGIPYPDLTDPTANLPAYYSAVADLLSAQAPTTFVPNLNQLDALIQSLEIQP